MVGKLTSKVFGFPGRKCSLSKLEVNPNESGNKVDQILIFQIPFDPIQNICNPLREYPQSVKTAAKYPD